MVNTPVTATSSNMGEYSHPAWGPQYPQQEELLPINSGHTTYNSSPGHMCRLNRHPNLAISSFNITSAHVVTVWSGTAKIPTHFVK